MHISKKQFYQFSKASGSMALHRNLYNRIFDGGGGGDAPGAPPVDRVKIMITIFILEIQGKKKRFAHGIRQSDLYIERPGKIKP